MPHKHPGLSSVKVPTEYSTLSPRPDASRAVREPNTAWQPEWPVPHPTSVGVTLSLPVLTAAETMLLPNLGPIVLPRKHYHAVGHSQLAHSGEKRAPGSILCLSSCCGQRIPVHSGASHNSGQQRWAVARPGSRVCAAPHTMVGLSRSRMATTKARWAQEAHLRPSEVPEPLLCIKIGTHQNRYLWQDTLSPPQSPHPPTHTRVCSHAHTHTHARTLSWALIFTGPNSQEEGKVVPGPQAWGRHSSHLQRSLLDHSLTDPAQGSNPNPGLSSLLLLSCQEKAGDGALEQPHQLGMAWSLQAGQGEAGGKGRRSPGTRRGWRFAKSELGTWWV